MRFSGEVRGAERALTSTMGADDDGDDKGDEEVTKGGAESASLPEGLEGTTAIFIHG